MDSDRRQSLRISNRLPFAWQTFSSAPTREDLVAAFGSAGWPHQRLKDISESIRLTLPMLAGETRDIVRLLEEKIDVAVDSMAFPAPRERYLINLSHEGLDFSMLEAQDPSMDKDLDKEEDNKMSKEDHLGVHLVMPYGNLICAANVTHCNNNRIGLRFNLDISQARLLSRYLITQKA